MSSPAGWDETSPSERTHTHNKCVNKSMRAQVMGMKVIHCVLKKHSASQIEYAIYCLKSGSIIISNHSFAFHRSATTLKPAGPEVHVTGQFTASWPHP